jgi:hypothetical protein
MKRIFALNDTMKERKKTKEDKVTIKKMSYD